MDFKQFLQLANESELRSVELNEMDSEGYKGHREDGNPYAKGSKATPSKAKDTAKDALKTLNKSMDKAHEKKKSLKDWFEAIDKNIVNEAEQITMEPAKQSTQVIKQGTKTLGTVSNPALAATIKSAIGKGEMSLAGDQLKEEEPMMEKAPPGMEDVVLSLKKKFPGEEGRAYAIAWSMYNKKHGKNEAAEDNPESAMLDEKWAGDAEVKPTGQYKDKSVEELKSMLAKLKKSGPHGEDSPEAKKQRQINFALRAKGGWKKGEGAALKEVDQPTIDNMSAKGAGLGRGRNPDVLESKQVNEAMNTLEAAYHEGKSHGLSKSNYACRYNEGSEEHKRYHDGFKEGLDECYGLMPNRGLVVSEVESEADIVDDMASYGADEGALGEMDKTAYMQHKAKTTPGDSFNAFGQTFKDKEVLEMDAFAFESLDKQLNDLLNEGLSVNMSQGLDGPGGAMEDTVSVTAQGDDAGKLLAFIKQVGLGGLGNAEASVEEPKLVAQISDYGAPKFGGYDNEPKSMMDLMKVMSGGEDYKDEEHSHDHADEQVCNECGMAEAKCGCDENKEMVDEVQTPDQLEADSVSEDDGEGYEQSQEAGAQIDSALAASGASKGGATNEDGMESNPLANGAVAAADADEEQEAAMKESSFLNLYKKLALLSEESTAEKDDKAEKAAKKVAKDIEYDEGHKGKDDDKAEKAGKEVKKDIEYDDKKDKKEKVDEWANDAGKDGTQTTFERDIEFMTKVISGGLNKPKSTGQTTIPVIAGQTDRMGTPKKEINESVSDWVKLAGLRK